jgi:PAS domain S-box-containing protein
MANAHSSTANDTVGDSNRNPGGQLRVRRRLVWFGLLIMLLAAGVMALSALYMRERELRSNRQLMEAVVQLIEEQTTRTFQTLDQRMQIATRGLTALASSGELNARSAGLLLRGQLADLPYARAFFYMNAQGRVLYDTSAATVGPDGAQRRFLDIYRTHPATDFYIAGPVRSGATGQWVITASRPIRAADGSVNGVLVATVDPTFFYRLWDSDQLGTGGTIGLFSADGTMMMRSPENQSAIGKVVPDLPMFGVMASATTGVYSRQSVVDGELRTYAFRRLSIQPDIVATVGQASSEILAPWRRFVALGASIWAIGSMVMVALGEILDRAWTRQLRLKDDARQMSERLALATEAIGIGIFDWDLATNHSYATATFFSMLGYPPEEGLVREDQWLDRIHPDDRARVKSAMDLVMGQRDAPYEYEVRIRHADGTYRWMAVAGRVMRRDREGKATRVLGVRTDITARHESEEALRQSEAMNQETLDSMEAQIAVFDRNGVIVAVNARWKQFALDNGVPPGQLASCCSGAEDLGASSAAGAETSGDAGAAGKGIKAVLDGTLSAFSMEYPCHSPTRLRWFSMNVTPLRRELGGAVVAHTDVTERKQFEHQLASQREDLRASALRYRMLFEQAPDGIVIADADGRFAEVNGELATMLGYQRGELVGKQARDIVSPEQSPRVEGALQALASGRERRREWQLRRQDGSRLMADIIAVVMPDGNLLATIRDITQRRQNEQALRDLLQDKEALFKEVQHRVKNNLQVIHSLLRLESTREKGSFASSALRDMQERVHAMALLHDMLYRTGTFASVDLGDYLRQLCTQAFRAMDSRHGAVRLELQLASVRLDMDQAMSCGLIANELLSNCFKHAFPGDRRGLVRVELLAPQGGDAVTLRVSDNGVGLRDAGSAARENSLGLQLVADLAAQLDGTLETDSGSHTVFSVAFSRNRPKPPVPVLRLRRRAKVDGTPSKPLET